MKEFMEDIIRRAGKLTLEYRSRLADLKINRKSAKDFVSEADCAVEQFLFSQIRARFPSHGLLGEESGETPGAGARWIIDPIDGTVSFVRGLPIYSISIALEQAGRVTFGAVFAPVLDELYFAELGSGATLNGKAVSVSCASTLPDCLFGTGFACVRQELKENNLLYFPKVFPHLFEIRRLGSAALQMCYVADGRLDGFWEIGLGLHDIAAGKLIIEEAGGKCTDMDGNTDQLPHKTAATNGRVHDQFINLLKNVRIELKKTGKLT